MRIPDTPVESNSKGDRDDERNEFRLTQLHDDLTTANGKHRRLRPLLRPSSDERVFAHYLELPSLSL
jgi:hypothetical protein